MAKEKQQTNTQPEPSAGVDPFAHVGDEHWGKGGRYIVDPATGKREPAPAEAVEG